MSSSVYSSVRAMKQCATDHADKWPAAARVVHEDFYVDDCLTGADGPAEAIKLYEDLSALLLKGGFELAKWASNDERVLQSVQGANSIVELSDEAEAKVLGLRWAPATDELTFRVVSPATTQTPGVERDRQTL